MNRVIATCEKSGTVEGIAAHRVPMQSAVARRWGHCLLVATCLAWLAGCGTDIAPNSAGAVGGNSDSVGDLAVGDVPGDAMPAPDPLVGTWTFSGHVPAIVTITLTFKADRSFTFSETVAPLITPVGYVPNGCITTHSLYGTYAAAASSGVNTLTWTFIGGTANAISGCNNPASDFSGTPMTPADITGYTAQGLIPPTTETFVATATTLVLTTTSGDSRTFVR